METVGLRDVPSWVLVELSNPDKAGYGLRKGVRFAEGFVGYADRQAIARLGPRAEYSCSQDFIMNVRIEAYGLKVGTHIRLAESEHYLNGYVDRLGSRPVNLLYDMGFLRRGVVVARCIYVGAGGIPILARQGVSVAHNPTYNMKAALGTPRMAYMLKAGIKVGIVIGCPASNNSIDMFRETEQSALLQKISYGGPAALSRDIPRIATIEAANPLGPGHIIGSLEAGKQADIVPADLGSHHMIPLHYMYEALMYSASGADADTALIGDNIAVSEGKLAADEVQVMEVAMKAAIDLLGSGS